MAADLRASHDKTLPLEVAVFSGSDGLRAQQLGASRIELNAQGSYDAGGLTPRVEDLEAIISELDIPVRIMIRPRGPPPKEQGGSDFIYTDEELAAMRESILEFKTADLLNPLRGDGFVFGVLSSSEENREKHGEALFIDTARCRELIELARPIPCVFHRAFDPIARSLHWRRGLDTLKELGFQGLLTSGGPGTYVDNLPRVLGLCRHASTKSTTAPALEIVVGGGVRHGNVAGPARELAALRNGSIWMHTACIGTRGQLDVEGLVELVGVLVAATPD
jgi:copper homeostasis protein